MNSLVFLTVRSLKNTFLEVLHKPAKLALWLLILVGGGGSFFLAQINRQHSEGSLDRIWLKGILFLFISLFVAISVQKGLSNGDVIFEMSDVNLLFVSPVSPRVILGYGIVRMARMAFWAGFFILFQGSSLSNFGIGFGSILLIWLGFMLAVSLLQIISLLIYVLTNGRPARKTAARVIAIAVYVPLAVLIVVQSATTGNLPAALENALRSPFLAFTPVAGWAAEGTIALVSGSLGTGALFFGLIVLAGAALVGYIALSNPDYYEDVLVATESVFERKRAMLEGQINLEATSDQKVKVVKTGIGGFGASTLFHKHLRESFRSNRLGLWGLTSILTVAGAAVASLFLRGAAGGVLILLQVLMWMQIFLIGTGRGLKELYTHYIYLIPESSFIKIIWSNIEVVLKVLVESAVLFGIAGGILGEGILTIVALIAVYTLFSLLLLGTNYLSLRWTGTSISAGLLIFIYIIAVILILLPGLIAAIIISGAVPGNGLTVGLGILAVWELIAALGCFALAKGILHHSDMPTVKTG